MEVEAPALSARLIIIETPMAKLADSPSDVKRWVKGAEEAVHKNKSLGTKSVRESRFQAIDIGFHATRGADRNLADRNGIAYSIGSVMATKLQLADFDAGTQRAATSEMDVLCNSSKRVEHLVPRPFASNSSAEVEEHLLIDGGIMHKAAKFTSELVRERAPEMYDVMSRHARNYRLFGDREVLWTTARVAFMRQGSKVKRHKDEENMPGTLGADMIFSFGEVSGATLTLHIDGKAHAIDGAKTVLADFQNEHEVSELEGSGLRVALIFWQQRTVVLSDHVVNALGAPVFDAGWKTLRPHPHPLSHERSAHPLTHKRSANGDLIFVLGHHGAGKTTVVRTLVKALQTPKAELGADGRKGAWLRGNGGAVAIFGRWQGHHDDGSSTKAGRLDGCDRLCSGFDTAACKKALPTLHAEGVRLLVADGAKLLSEPFLQLAQHLGYAVRLLELDTPAEVAAARARTRDAGTESAGKEDPWSKKREGWIEDHKKAPLTKVSSEQAKALLHALAAADAPPEQEPPDDEVAAAFMLRHQLHLKELPDAAPGASSVDVQMAAATDDAA